MVVGCEWVPVVDARHASQRGRYTWRATNRATRPARVRRKHSARNRCRDLSDTGPSARHARGSFHWPRGIDFRRFETFRRRCETLRATVSRVLLPARLSADDQPHPNHFRTQRTTALHFVYCVVGHFRCALPSKLTKLSRSLVIRRRRPSAIFFRLFVTFFTHCNIPHTRVVAPNA